MEGGRLRSGSGAATVPAPRMLGTTRLSSGPAVGSRLPQPGQVQVLPQAAISRPLAPVVVRELLRSPRMLRDLCDSSLASVGARGQGVLDWNILQLLCARMCSSLGLPPFPQSRLRSALAACGRPGGALAASEFHRFFELCLLASEIAEGRWAPGRRHEKDDDCASASSATTAPPKASPAKSCADEADKANAEGGELRLPLRTLLQQARPLRSRRSGEAAATAAPSEPSAAPVLRRLAAAALRFCSLARLGGPQEARGQEQFCGSGPHPRQAAPARSGATAS